MRPSKLNHGDKVIYTCLGGTERLAVFICREPARFGHPARNFLKFPDFVGLDGIGDQGICPVSDYDLSRKGRLA